VATKPTTYTEVGSFEAKTKLSELLRKVEQGERFTITIRGRAVADLVPAENPRKQVSDEILNRLRNPPIRGIPDETVLEWIREGRE
jgi:prevent-host-death family protein